MVASVALCEEGVPIAELSASARVSHSEHVLADVAALLSRAHWKLDDLDGLAVSVGPGSFTGVRIGVTTARTLAWTLGRPLVGRCALEILAQNASGRPGLVAAMFDARKQEVYFAVYRVTQGRPETVAPPRVAAPDKACDVLRALPREADEPCWLLGEGLLRYREVFAGAAPWFREGSTLDHRPRAAHLGALGHEALVACGWVADPRRVEPLYVRPSEAELADAARAVGQKESSG